MPKADVVLLTLDYPPERGGVARYLGNLVAAAYGRMRVIVEKRHLIDGPGVVENVELFRSAWPKWWPMIQVIRDLSKQQRETTLVLSHVFPVGTAAWIARMFGGPAYVVIVHGMDLRLVQSLWKRWILRRICQKALAVMANSEMTKAAAVALVPGLRVRVLTPGVEGRPSPDRALARRRLSIDEDVQLVVSVGRLVTRKGIDLALRAMSRIQKHRDVQYVVVGDGEDLPRLEKMAVDCRARVTWVRNATDEEKWLWLEAADIFLLPTRDEGESVEGFGIAFLEAAMAGIPVVAGDSGGVSEAVRHERTGLLVKPTSIDDIEQAVMRLLGDPEFRQKLGHEARERVLTDFRWEDRVAVLLQEIDKQHG